MNKGIYQTNFEFPGQTAFYRGKVRDVYEIRGRFLVIVSTDRISAFDHILPQIIPQKGAILNRIAAHNLTETKNLVPNWFITSPHPYVSVGYKCDTIPVEMIVRNYLCGHALRMYQKGGRELCGNQLPEGLKPYQQLPEPILTPTTKAQTGHDEDITPEAILQNNIVSDDEWQTLKKHSFNLFAKGTEQSLIKGLLLADTKYEFGKFGNEIRLIDEVHTPDSSRFFLKDDYEKSFKENKTPEQLSKEFVRQWLIEEGFEGKTGQKIPELTSEKVSSIQQQYLKLFERFTGEKFDAGVQDDPEQEIFESVSGALKNL